MDKKDYACFRKVHLLVVLLGCVFTEAFAYEFSANSTSYYGTATIYYNRVNNNGTYEAEVTRGDVEYSGDIIIPETVTDNDGNSLSVTSIGDNAFSGYSNLYDVYIPNNVTTIGENAFSSCTNLYGVYIPNNVTTIGENAFSSCTNLYGVYIPNNVTNIGNNAFSGCTALVSITIPDNVKCIGDNAFQNCSDLKSVTIGSSVESIGENAFNGCSKLERVFVKDIAAWCGIKFYGNESNPLYYAHNLHRYDSYGTEIKDLEIPDNVTSIRNYAFSG